MKKLSTAFVLLLIISTNMFSQNVNLSNGNIFDGEPYVAINPTNSQNIVVAWQGYVFGSGSSLTIRIKSSFNGGLTWNTAVNMPHVNSAYKSADPSLAFDTNGNLFLSYIDHRESPDSGGVFVSKSINGGLTWSAPIKAIDVYADGTELPIDRPFISVSSNGNNLYLTTKPPSWVAAPNRPYFVASTNGGATWQPWRYVDSTGFLVGALIPAPFAPNTVSASNKFHSMYPSYVPSQNILPQFILASSSTAGVAMTHKNVYASNNLANNDSAKLAYQLIADPTNSNHLAFFFPQNSSGDIDIMMIETFNEGTSWTAPVRINDDVLANGKMQDMLWADFDNDGDIVVSWRDRRNASGGGFLAASEFYASYRDKDSTNFSANFKISDSLVAYNNVLAQDGNDFMSIAIENDTLSAAWGNTRDGSLDVWFVRMHAPTATTTSISLIESSKNNFSIYPNPSTGVYSIETIDQAIINKIEVHDLTGKLVKSIQSSTKSTTIDLTNLQKGIYIVTIFSNNTSTKRTVVKQ